MKNLEAFHQVLDKHERKLYILHLKGISQPKNTNLTTTKHQSTVKLNND